MTSRGPTEGARPGLDKLAVLRGHPVFGQLAPDQIQRLMSFASSMKLKRSATIFAKGDPGTSLFAVLAGTVKIEAPSAGGRVALLNLVRAGEIFGEIALLDGRPRTADAIAMTDCELVVIDRQDFIPFVSSKPDVAIKLVEGLCALLRHVSAHVEDVTFRDLPSRLAKALLRLAENAEPVPGGRRIAMTQSEIGQMIGMTRETTNRQLHEWAKHEWIRLEQRGIVVVSPRALARIASADGGDDG